jgi:hypothetical protein
MGNSSDIRVTRPEEKRPFGGHRHRWGDNIRMDFRETGWQVVDWIHLAKDMDQ